MSELLSTRVTVGMLNAFSAESKRLHRWPAAWDRAFCQATGDYALLVCRVLRAGFFVITAEEHDLLELGRQYLLQKRAAEEISRIERSLQGVDL